MTPKTIENLRKLVGHVCSVMTAPVSRPLAPAEAVKYFVVRVEEIGSDGLWGTHPLDPDLVSWFRWEHVVSLHTEPSSAEQVERLNKPTVPDSVSLPVVDAPPISTGEGDAMFVDIAHLEKLAADAQRIYQAQDVLSHQKPLT